LGAYQLKRKTFLESSGIMADAGQATDNAFYFYESARLVAELGEYTKATELIKKGNEARENFRVELFPLTFIKQNISEIPAKDWTNGKYRLLCVPARAQPAEEDNVRLKTTMKEYQVIISLSGDIGLLNVLHRFACRLGQEKYGGLTDQLAASVISGMVQATYEDLCSDAWTKKQHQALLQLERYRQSVRGYYRAFSLAMDLDTMKQGESPREPLEATRAQYWDYFMDWWTQQKFVQEWIFDYVENEFRKMADFDFTNPEGYRYLRD